MEKPSRHRILRNYRNRKPTNFHTFNQRIKKSLIQHAIIAELMRAANPTLLSSYLFASEQHDALHYEAQYGHKLVIFKREALQSQLVDYLDEIASLLESLEFRHPGLLIGSGFDLAKERRKHPRTKAAKPVAVEVTAFDPKPPSS